MSIALPSRKTYHVRDRPRRSRIRLRALVQLLPLLRIEGLCYSLQHGADAGQGEVALLEGPV